MLASFVTGLNALIDNPQVAGAILAAGVIGVCGALWRGFDRLVLHRLTVSVTTIFDQAVNITDQNVQISVTGAAATGTWTIPAKGTSGTTAVSTPPSPASIPSTVESIVILRIANSGVGKIALNSRRDDPFSVFFPGRKILAIKVREPEELIGEPGRPLPPDRFSTLRTLITTRTCVETKSNGAPADPSRLTMPNDVVLYKKEAFQLAIFLSGVATDPKQKVAIRGDLARGKIIIRRKSWWRRFLPAAIPSAVALAVLVTFGVGALTAHQALVPGGPCAGDVPMTIEGSTAFAPVATEAIAAYKQACPAADITIVADGSDAAISDHKPAGPLPNDVLLMVDDSDQQVPRSWKATPVGIVIFGVVENKDFDQAVSTSSAAPEGYSPDGLANLYRTASSPGASYIAVGRSGNSGTAQALERWTGLSPSVLDSASKCKPLPAADTSPVPNPAVRGLCDVGTTQEMLAYVNTYANAIGFADVDEISEYPNLKTVPIQSDSSGGVSTFVQPSVATVNSGTYGFATPEDLYTSQNPSLQVSAFLSFLNSPAEMKQLATQNQGYIPCDDLGTADAGDCANP